VTQQRQETAVKPTHPPEPPEPVRRRLPPAEWVDWDDEKLLDLRLCDLDLHIDGSPLEPMVAELKAELAGRGLEFRPHFWLSDEFFTPDGIPGVAIPFYLAHPRLAKLELNQMLEVEGGTPDWCLRILRHEAGHAVENAYHLRRRRRRQVLFGKTSEPYPESYEFRPYSRSFVMHLESGYAQSHPDEDFAETFAVWLTPGSAWRERYLGWPALKKLEYVDTVMTELAGKPPIVSHHQTLDPLSRLRKTLRTHYRRKREHYAIDNADMYDRDLRRLFSNAPEHASAPAAAAFLSRIRRETRRLVRSWTGVRQYSIDQVFGDMLERCRALGLRLAVPEDRAKMEFTILLTVQTLKALHEGRLRLAL
jgi:putative zinc-binding metallo-peptidase